MIRMVKPSLGVATEKEDDPAELAAVLTRKRSVTTADFFKEAQEVMQKLRQRVQPMKALSESNDPLDARALFSETVEPFSRPPSRENPAPQKEEEEMDSVIVHHLEKFKDSDDLGLALGSSIKAMRRHSEANPTNSISQGDPSDSRIAERPRSSVLDEDATEQDHDASEDEQEIQHESHKSSSSGAHTTNSHGTRSSGSSRLKTVISPDKVSHLISENVGKMTFDPATLRWVKRGSASKSQGQISSDPSEEDPLKEIPDLAVDDKDEGLHVATRTTSRSEGIRPGHADDNTRASVNTAPRRFPDDIEDSRASFARMRPSTLTPPTSTSQPTARLASGMSKHRRASLAARDRNLHTAEQTVPPSAELLNSQKPSKMRNVMFSSPPEVERPSLRHNTEAPPSHSLSIPSRNHDRGMSSLRRISTTEPIAEELEFAPQAEQDGSLVHRYPTPESDIQGRSSQPDANPESQESMALKPITPAAQQTPPPKPNDLLRVALNSSVGFHLSPFAFIHGSSSR